MASELGATLLDTSNLLRCQSESGGGAKDWSLSRDDPLAMGETWQWDFDGMVDSAQHALFGLIGL